MGRMGIDWRRVALGASLVALIVVVSIGIFANQRVDSWIASGRFVQLLDRETSKGLKLDAQYAPVSRIGFLGMRCDDFWGTSGPRTIVELDAHNVTGRFNPLGFFLQRWQVDDIHIQWGTVMLQTTQPSGQKSPGKPWWGWFWPYRVHLGDVKCDDACALWQLKGKESGIYHTFLEITPNGHDFEYDARGGDFKTPLTPPLKLSHLHMLIRKPRLYCDELLLGEDATQSGGQVRISGDAGLQEDRSIKLAVDLTSLKIAPWLPENLRGHVLGHFSGHLDYASTGSSLDTASGDGHFDVADAVLHQLPPLQHYITLTGSPDPGDLPLKVCQTDVTLKEGAITAENLQIESPGVFRVRGTIEVAKDKTLSGSLTLGLTDPYLKWLPNARQTIFTQDDGDYRVTTIELSGTLEHPKEDLSPRVMAQIQKSPGTELKLFFNQAGEWFGIH